MVLLRTYDERSVVYHRQGRIGTYAIFWGHEAIQAGAVHALEDEDWIFPSYRESAIGLLRGMPAATVLSWWRGHPAGWWNPADYNVASICVPIATQVPHAAGLAWGKRLRGESGLRADVLRRRRHLRGRLPRGRELRRRDARAARPPLQQQPVGDLDAALRRRRRAEALVDKAAGYGIPGLRVDGGDVLAVYEATREAVARARAGERADVHRGGHATAARRTRPRTTRRPTSTWSGSRRSGRTSASAASRAISAGRGCCTTTSTSRSRPRRPT